MELQELQINISKMQPLHDNVLVEVFEKVESKTKSGIIIPTSSNEKSNFGLVVAVGTGTLSSNGERCALSIKPGDKIIFKEYAGTKISEEHGKKYLMMKESDILCTYQ